MRSGTLVVLSILLLPSQLTAQRCDPSARGMRVDTVSGDRQAIWGRYATPRPVLDWILLTPQPMGAIPRRAEVQPNGEFYFGPVPPGRYLMVTPAPTGTPSYGVLYVGTQPLALCLGTPVRVNLASGEPFISSGPGSPIPGATLTDAEATAIGDALGRWLAATHPGAVPFSLNGTDEPLATAARRGYAAARGDTILPPTERVHGRVGSVVDLYAVGLAGSDSAVVIASQMSCTRQALVGTGMTGSSENGAFMVVRVAGAWVVRRFVSQFHAKIGC